MRPLMRTSTPHTVATAARLQNDEGKAGLPKTQSHRLVYIALNLRRMEYL